MIDLALLLLAGAPAGPRLPGAVIEGISVPLSYERSGTPPPIIAPPGSIFSWTSVTGPGDARETAQDVRMTARRKPDIEAHMGTQRKTISVNCDSGE